ncbi:MAG: DUF2203 domain-containing protein [Bryobacteraceae bacterium]|nr:DUF2203 domain-containing protein [Bryobacteraceae bacterium]
MPRFFTLAQAERTLPRVEAAIRTATGLKAEYQLAEDGLRELSHKVMMSGGMAVNHHNALGLRNRRDSAATRLQEVMAEIQEFGCLVKDLNIGLLDFPTLYHGREVYLCWRLGEQRIAHWHGVEEGFQSRKAIDDEFLANHTGDSVS